MGRKIDHETTREPMRPRGYVATRAEMRRADGKRSAPRKRRT